MKWIKKSSYEKKAENILKKMKVDYIFQSPYIVPWRRFKPDFYINIWFKKIVIEIDWEYHNTLRSKIYDFVRDVLFYYHWIDQIYRLKPKDLRNWKLEKLLLKEQVEYNIIKIMYYIIGTALLLYSITIFYKI